MVKHTLWKTGVVFTFLAGVTSGLAQEKPPPPLKADGRPDARQAEEDTPKEKVARRRWAKLSHALQRKLESPEQKDRVKDRAPGRPDTQAAMTRVSQTCLICRLTRVDTTSAQQTTTKYEENECSRWYSANVEPNHKHVWEYSTCTFGSSDDGTFAFVACNPGHFAIWLLDPETQLAVYQHFKKPIDARDLFLSLADAKTFNDRLDEHDQNKGTLIVDALEEWEAASFPGTWKEWWEPWYAKHVEEHKEYLTWLHSDSGLNFSDWQRQRKASRAPAGAAAKSKK
jgi:hypothetical protein